MFFFFPSLQFYLLSFLRCFVVVPFYWFDRPSCKQTQSVYTHAGEVHKKFILNASKVTCSQREQSTSALHHGQTILCSRNISYFIFNISCLTFTASSLISYLLIVERDKGRVTILTFAFLVRPFNYCYRFLVKLRISTVRTNRLFNRTQPTLETKYHFRLASTPRLSDIIKDVAKQHNVRVCRCTCRCIFLMATRNRKPVEAGFPYEWPSFPVSPQTGLVYRY